MINKKSLFETHIHSENSFDCERPIIDVCDDLYEKGFTGVCFTDHFECGYAPGKPAKDFDYNKLSKDIDEARIAYKGRMEIGKGVEIGLQLDNQAEIKDFIKDKQFDFILGSVHYIDGLEIYGGKYSKGKTEEEFYLGYLKHALEVIKVQDDFDVFAHLDLVARVDGYSKHLEKPEYMPYVDEILKTLIRNGKGIEINTSLIRYGQDYPHPHYKIIKRYVDLGGEIITCGSDSHTQGSEGEDIREMYDFLRQIGVEYITFFNNRVPTFRKIY